MYCFQLIGVLDDQEDSADFIILKKLFSSFAILVVPHCNYVCPPVSNAIPLISFSIVSCFLIFVAQFQKKSQLFHGF